MLNVISELFETGRIVSLEAKQTVFQTGDHVRLMYLVTEGEIDLVRFTKGGTQMILARVHPGKVLAEASAYSNHYHCDGVTNSWSRVRSLPVSEFRERLHGSPDAAQTWATLLARELQKARMQSEIRSLKTVAERLDAWLGESNNLPPKGQIQDLARFLSVSREALYRELARRRS
ncbi:Crp/Fnr family transcriptional regulator [Ruegeria sp. HKCCD8929]|uniref:Crp/Fnr family transcriptional regulator n=1 Tax=Ruegeria sp. HKCCD8929 TaxID=2683006 RepID=UPI001488F6D3|nr:Crp/Fnr family transcriptional regulator [Ruegeria sp. HKCCD8929]